MKAVRNLIPIGHGTVPQPQVFTDEFVGKLRAVNRQVRWMREQHLPLLAIDLKAARPTLMVKPTPAAVLALILAGSGMNITRGEQGSSVCSTVIDGCDFRWEG